MVAYLELEDGTKLEGVPFGSQNSRSGEVVFTTSMVGYPESLTDPSYKDQILTFTYPLIGNYGVRKDARDAWGLPERFESDKIHVAGVILSQPPRDYSHWDATRSLDAWLRAHGIPGLHGIDTRALTKKLREKGVMLGRIVIDKVPEFDDPNTRNLVAQVSRKQPHVYGDGDCTIALIDCGAKDSIIRALLARGARVHVLPWDHDPTKVAYDGLALSNGPGDPAMMDVTVRNLKSAIALGKPIFGVCLGNQLLARAAGAGTYKLRYGHRSHNQPCVDRLTGRCFITSQNHGFAVDAKTLGGGFKEWFANANDATNEGIIHGTGPFSSVQFHPEARGGPLDTTWLFDRFLEQVRRAKR
jgi:carbamoyl-phosphate synthase small subunit